MMLKPSLASHTVVVALGFLCMSAARAHASDQIVFPFLEAGNARLETGLNDLENVELAQNQGQSVEAAMSIYRRLMDAPNNVDLNLLYAEQTERQGNLRRALEAYKRILLTEPDHLKAKTEIARLESLLAPSKTKVSLSLGAFYETNSPKRDPRFLSYDDTTATLGVLVDDTRAIAGRSWRTTLQGFGSAHNRWRQGNLTYFGVSSGPNIYLDNGWKVRVAPKASYALLDGKGLFSGGGIVTDWAAPGNGSLRNISASLGYSNYFGAKDNRSGAVFELKPLFVHKAVFADEDLLAVRPSYRFVGGTKEFSYHSARVGLSYIKPFNAMLIGAASVGAEGRAYRGHAADEASNRRDYKLDPGVSLTFRDILPGKGKVVGRYTYEVNWSNDYDKKFETHILGVNTVWNF